MSLVTSGSFGNPKADYELYAEQLGGSGNTREIKVTFKIKIDYPYSSSRYGYPINWKARIGSDYSDWMKVKGTEFWYGGMDWKTYSWIHTIDVGTTDAKELTIGFQTDAPGYSSSWEQTRVGNFEVMATNVAPTAPGWINIHDFRGSKKGALLESGYINENIDALYAVWGQSTDANRNDRVSYILQENRNRAGWKNIDTGTDTEHSFPAVGGEGTTYQYRVQAVDNNGGASSWNYTQVLTKNTFTMPTLSSFSSIQQDTPSLRFTYSGGSNTQSGVNIGIMIKCEGLTVYNNDPFASNSDVAIYRSSEGAPPRTAYIDWDELVSKFSSSGGKGTLRFYLLAITSNGTFRESNRVSVSVNVQSKPGGITGAKIVKSSDVSPGYRRCGSDGQYYFLPNGSAGRRIRVQWNAAHGSFGDGISYDVWISYDNGAWETVASKLTQTFFDHVIPSQSARRTFKYKIRAVSSSNGELFTDTVTPAEELQSYGEPTLTIVGIERNANNALVKIKVTTPTSISSVRTTGRWSTSGGSGSGNLNATQDVQVLKVTNLGETSTPTITVSYDDNTGFSMGPYSQIIKVSESKPLFFVNKWGVGIGGVKAREGSALLVNGGTLIQGELTVGDIEKSNLVAGINATASVAAGDANAIWRSGFYAFSGGKNYPPDGAGWYYLINAANPDNSKKGQKHNFQISARMDEKDTKVFVRNTKPDGSGDWKLLGGGGIEVNKQQAKKDLVNLVYPVGSIYMSVNSTSPASLFGGSWERWGNGRVPVGVDSYDNKFDYSEKTGGSKTAGHRHDADGLIAAIGAYDERRGNLGYENAYAVGSGFTYGFRHSEKSDFDTSISKSRVTHGTRVYGSTSSTSASTLQPYITCYMWKRIG